MSDKNFMALIGVIVVVIVGAIFLFGGDDETNAGTFIGDPLGVATGEVTLDENGNEVGTQPADHTKGNPDAAVTLIEFADFECPACGAFFPVLQQLETQYPDDLLVVFRHNPLTQLHPNAMVAHRAAQAAANQGQFWEMHDLLYSSQRTWSSQVGVDTSGAATIFEGFARDNLGLDMDRYTADIESQEVFNYIDSHLDSGSQLGVTGTPTLYLNGELITVRSFEEISQLINDILAEQSSDSAN